MKKDHSNKFNPDYILFRSALMRQCRIVGNGIGTAIYPQIPANREQQDN